MRACLKCLTVVCVLVASSLCDAGIINDIQVQVNGRVDTLSGKLANDKWTVTASDIPYQYQAVQSGRKVNLDLSSPQKISSSLSSMFVDQIFVNFAFRDVIPNSTAYINNRKYINISSSGNFDNNLIFLQTMPGNHKIELNKSNSIVEKSEVDIEHDGNVVCSGRAQMVCKFAPY